jgi:type IV secretory pathway VirB4 component
LARGVCVDDLDEVTLTKEYSPENLKALLADYEKDDAVDWYFDRNYSSLADLGDYHRLVLKDVSVYAHTRNDD